MVGFYSERLAEWDSVQVVDQWNSESSKELVLTPDLELYFLFRLQPSAQTPQKGMKREAKKFNDAFFKVVVIRSRPSEIRSWAMETVLTLTRFTLELLLQIEADVLVGPGLSLLRFHCRTVSKHFSTPLRSPIIHPFSPLICSVEYRRPLAPSLDPWLGLADPLRAKWGGKRIVAIAQSDLGSLHSNVERQQSTWICTSSHCSF